jgi:hypothetical protein
MKCWARVSFEALTLGVHVEHIAQIVVCDVRAVDDGCPGYATGYTDNFGDHFGGCPEFASFLHVPLKAALTTERQGGSDRYEFFREQVELAAAVVGVL